MRRLTTAAATAALLALGLASDADAAAFTFGFDEPTSGGSEAAGSYDRLRFTFDEGVDGADGFAVSPTIDVSGALRLNTEFGTASGGWFALTPGGDPRQADDQIAIFYMDFATGRVSAYRYDGTLGTNGIKTYQNDDLFIASFENAVQTTVADGVLTFDIDGLDLSLVQTASEAAGYTGASFAEEIGVWFHLSVLRGVAFAEDGRVTDFRVGALASFDLPRSDAGLVTPLPGAALFVLTGIAGIGAIRRARG